MSEFMVQILYTTILLKVSTFFLHNFDNHSLFFTLLEVFLGSLLSRPLVSEDSQMLFPSTPTFDPFICRSFTLSLLSYSPTHSQKSIPASWLYYSFILRLIPIPMVILRPGALRRPYLANNRPYSPFYPGSPFPNYYHLCPHQY